MLAEQIAEYLECRDLRVAERKYLDLSVQLKLEDLFEFVITAVRDFEDRLIVDEPPELLDIFGRELLKDRIFVDCDVEIGRGFFRRATLPRGGRDIIEDRLKANQIFINVFNLLGRPRASQIADFDHRPLRQTFHGACTELHLARTDDLRFRRDRKRQVDILQEQGLRFAVLRKEIVVVGGEIQVEGILLLLALRSGDNRDRLPQFKNRKAAYSLLALDLSAFRGCVVLLLAEFLEGSGRADPVLCQDLLGHAGSVVFDDDRRIRADFEFRAEMRKGHPYP